MWFQRGENPMIQSIEEKISRYTRTPISHGENIQCVRYRKGGYYKEHYDYFEPEYAGNQAVLNRGGQRIITCMIYLNDVIPTTIGTSGMITNSQSNTLSAGGETYFPRVGHVGLRVSPRVGRALIWYNVTGKDNTPDESTYHSGEPVTVEGCEKFILTKWVREREFR